MQGFCAELRCILFGAVDFYKKKKLAQESMTYVQETCASFW